ncbi:MAG: cell division protein FtsA [candidate division Zixibacteria bacterium]|nr:cell division protein FtsA [candidate division Zixibacteria bacterium]
MKRTVACALDIGSTKVAAAVVENPEERRPRLVGLGVAPACGVRRGVVVDLFGAVDSIRRAVRDAEMIFGEPISLVVAGIGGEHLKSLHSRGGISVAHSSLGISLQEMQRAVAQARSVSLPHDREIFHTIPFEYVLDGQPGIKDPRGMSGWRLEADVHLVTGSTTAAQNLYRCVEKAGVEPCDLVLSILGAAETVLVPAEKVRGAILLDIGGASTHMAVFLEGELLHTFVIPLGGGNVTNDVAIGLRLEPPEAEELKKNFGVASSHLVDPEETLVLPPSAGRGERKISHSILASIIEPRMEEIFGLALRELRSLGLSEFLTGGVVLTGGGAMLSGAARLAEEIFDLPARVGVPGGFGGSVEQAVNPQYATAVGLAMYACGHELGQRKPRGRVFGFFEKTVDWMKEYL